MKRKTRMKCRIQWQRPRYVPCGDCSYGWAQTAYGVKRCWCWIAHQRKLETSEVYRERVKA